MAYEETVFPYTPSDIGRAFLYRCAVANRTTFQSRKPTLSGTIASGQTNFFDKASQRGTPFNKSPAGAWNSCVAPPGGGLDQDSILWHGGPSEKADQMASREIALIGGKGEPRGHLAELLTDLDMGRLSRTLRKRWASKNHLEQNLKKKNCDICCADIMVWTRVPGPRDLKFTRMIIEQPVFWDSRAAKRFIFHEVLVLELQSSILWIDGKLSSPSLLGKRTPCIPDSIGITGSAQKVADTPGPAEGPGGVIGVGMSYPRSGDVRGRVIRKGEKCLKIYHRRRSFREGAICCHHALILAGEDNVRDML
ncbi:hypothetical protein C8J57DRAFT_1223172 [Mycena rebaudengoi]|nr:hypothetical protein C8J57DRAFT_1223172 [Mycena rebaudengoi]